MIHFIKQGESFRLGLNIAIAKGGFVAIWMWMDISSHIATKYRFRLRLHMRPWIIWEVERKDIFIEFLKRHDFDVVSREVINDLKAMEDFQMHRYDHHVTIKSR